MEYLITDAGERVAIPDAVVSASQGRELVAQFCATDAAGRIRIEAQAKRTLGEDATATPAPPAPIVVESDERTEQ